MFPVGARIVCSVVGAESLGHALSGRIDDTDQSLETDVIDGETVANGDVAARRSDCLLIDADTPAIDAIDTVQRWNRERPHDPVVLLVDGWPAEEVTEALSVGVTEVLPRGLVDDDPNLLAERLATAVERDRARTSVRELYDELAGLVSLHDTDSGELIHANERLCDRLGYDREHLLSMPMGEFIADVPGYDRDWLVNVVTSAAKQNDPMEIEWPVTTADGTVRWLESRLRRIQLGGRDVVLSTGVDVTERHRQERKYEQVFDNVNDVISVHDPWGEELVDVNETMTTLTGYSRETLLELDVGGFSVADDGFTEERAYEIQQRVAATGEAETVEWMIETAAGERRLLEANLAPATIAGEDRVLALSRDVTERTEYEQRLERERDRRSVLFENNPDPILRVTFEDDDPVIQEVNPAFEDIFGFPSEEVVGDTIADAVVPESEREAHERLSTTVAQGGTVEKEGPRRTADGIRQFFFKVIQFDTDADVEDASDAYVWYTDITERKRREREYEQLFNGVNDSITVHDPETAELLDVNETFCELLGYDRETILELGIEGYSPSDEAYTMEQARAFVSEVVESDDPKQTEWVVETKNGEKRWLDVKGTTVELGGELRYVSIDRDITERKRRERMIRALHEATDELQEADTIEAVYETAIDAASEVLDLRLPTCWLRESDETDLLTPVASSDETEALPPGAHPRSLAPDDTEYSVYDAGERRVFDPSELDGMTPPEKTVVFPLGDHGLFGAAAEDGAFDDVTLDAAGILARHVTAALDRVERARELRERERRFRLIADHIDEIIYVSTADFSEILYINPAYEEIYGRPVEKLSADPTSFVDAAHPDDRADYEADVERLIADIEAGDPQDAYEGEYRIERDGETRWVTVTRFPVATDDGTVDRIVGRVADITERKRREREYEQIFNMAGDGIVIHDPDSGEVVDANDQIADLLGYDREAFLDRPLSEFQATDEGVSGQQAREKILTSAREGGQEFEWPLETADGETVWVRARHELGEIGGEQRIVALLHDITERRRREREYEQIFDGVNDVIAVHDPETGALVDVNSTMCALTGYDRETILQQGVEALLVSDPANDFQPERVPEIIDRVIEDESVEPYEQVIETSDGDRVWLEVNPTRAVIGGEERFVAISRDITERRRTERRLGEILDRIDDAIFMTRAEGITAATEPPDYVSAGYEEIWGQSVEAIRETYDEGFFGTLHPEDAGEYRAFVEGLVDDIYSGSAADSYAREYRIERPDGEVRWVHSDYYPAEWESGEPRVVIVSRDITDRKARERRIASFDDATDDLATADTPEEATRTAVEAATETLELPAVGVFLYDGDDGVLRPEVRTGQLPDALAMDPIGPGDGPLWDGFVNGTIVAPDGGHGAGDEKPADPEPPDALAALDEWRALALGNHGVLLVGAPDTDLAPETVQSAHVLAATLEAALNHLEGEQRLAAQEEQLRTQTERADRLDRIARLTQQVEAAITEASNPGDVEQAVCDRLGAGPYDLAWVGGVDVGDDRITARTVVGSSAQYVEALELTTAADTADPHPAVDAWRTDEVQVAESLVAEGPAGDWRRRALSEGYQSLCAIPLTYDGITHGVLTVGADSPNAFGDREQRVLAQLGTSIANALAAIERRRALESDETVELEFRGTGDALSFARAAAAADCQVRLERTAARQDGPVSVYYSFEGDVPDDAPEIAQRRLPGEVDVVTEESSSTLVEARTDDWFGAPLAEYGGVLREAAADPGEMTIRVEVPREADIRSFVERLQEIAPSVELVAQRQHQRQDRTPAEISDQVRAELTDRQFEVVQTALDAGYFQWPREHDGSEVADRLDITQPTFNKHLRLAEQKTFGLLFEADA